MKIALRYGGRIYVSLEAMDHCTDGCTADAKVCSLGICTGRDPLLAKHMGPLIWELLGPSESLETEALVLAYGRILRAVPHDTCRGCDWSEGALCDQYCLGEGDKSLCEILGKFFQSDIIKFREILT